MDVSTASPTVWEHTLLLFGDEKKALRWLATPLAELDDRTPEDVLRADPHTDAVSAILDRIEYGVFRLNDRAPAVWPTSRRSRCYWRDEVGRPLEQPRRRDSVLRLLFVPGMPSGMPLLNYTEVQVSDDRYLPWSKRIQNSNRATRTAVIPESLVLSREIGDSWSDIGPDHRLKPKRRSPCCSFPQSSSLRNGIT